MQDVKSKKLIVQCPLHPYSREVVYTNVTHDNEGKTVAACTGCDHASAAELCMRCIATVTLMYMAPDAEDLFSKPPVVLPLDRFAPKS